MKLHKKNIWVKVNFKNIPKDGLDTGGYLCDGIYLKPIKQVYVLTEAQLNDLENKSYKEGRESVSKADFNYD